MTAIVYDDQMCLHEFSGFDHPEKPERIRAIYDRIEKSSLISKCTKIPIRPATIEELKTVHDENYIKTMSLLPGMNRLELNNSEKQYNSIYLNKHTWNSALLSAGGVVELCDQVINGKFSNGIAIVRPPGHHAECSQAMGFCIFNNVAVAAKAMINKHGLKRIAIIDWDVHHGNATQHMFIDDPSVLYISIHRYDNANFYPASVDASPFVIGNGKAIGLNVNIAWNMNDSDQVGDSEYVYAFDKLVGPMLLEFDPELIIVSAGFDCAAGDPLGGLQVTPNGFHELTSKLTRYANGKIVIALEGGYNVEAISDSMLACLKGLLGIKCTKTPDKSVSKVGINAVNTTMQAHCFHWNFLTENA